MRLNKTKLIYIILIITIYCGATTGAILANIMQQNEFTEISNYLSRFMLLVKTEAVNKNNILMESIIKYSKTTIIIWFMAFVPYGVFITGIVLFFKGLSCGFTTALLIRQIGFDGILLATASFVPQNLLALPMYVALAFYSINQNIKKQKILRRRKKVSDKKLILEYLIILAACITISILSSLIETYISPDLMQMILNRRV